MSTTPHDHEELISQDALFSLDGQPTTPGDNAQPGIEDPSDASGIAPDNVSTPKVEATGIARIMVGSQAEKEESIEPAKAPSTTHRGRKLALGGVAALAAIGTVIGVAKGTSHSSTPKPVAQRTVAPTPTSANNQPTPSSNHSATSIPSANTASTAPATTGEITQTDPNKVRADEPVLMIADDTQTLFNQIYHNVYCLGVATDPEAQELCVKAIVGDPALNPQAVTQYTNFVTKMDDARKHSSHPNTFVETIDFTLVEGTMDGDNAHLTIHEVSGGLDADVNAGNTYDFVAPYTFKRVPASSVGLGSSDQKVWIEVDSDIGVNAAGN